MRRVAGAACAAVGFLSLWTLMPRHDAALGDGQPALGREEAIRRAVEWAREHGVEIRGWRFAAQTEVDPVLERIRRRGSSTAGAFTPMRIRVLAYNSAGDAVEVTMNAAGRPLSFLDRRQAVSGERGADAPEDELLRLAGAEAAMFQRTADNIRTLEGSRSAWEWPDAALEGTLARIVVVMRNGRVVNSRYEFQAAREAVEGLPAEGLPTRLLWGLVSLGSTAVIGGILLWTLFLTMQSRTDPFGFAARFLWIPAVALAAAFLSGNYQNDAVLRSFEDGLVGDSRLVFGMTLALLVLLVLFLILAAAYAVVPRWHLRLWAPVDLLVRGEWRNRQAAEQVWTGMTGGVLIGAVPYWIAAADTVRVRFLEGTNLLMAPAPALEALEGLVFGWEAYLVALFLFPWLSARVKRRTLVLGAALVAGTLVAALLRGPFPPGHPANLAVGALMTTGYLLVYRHGGMLGVWMAPLGMYGAVQGIRLVRLPAPSLETGGWQMLALVFGFAVAALGASFLLPQADTRAAEARMAEAASALPRSQREKLRAEFEVARRAQRDLLPAAPPQIEGFEVAAACLPAREVGGDLYDCLPCPQGRWLLSVADVSGKGLGAALHMTLLKGMLASAAHHAPPPGTLAARLNQAVAEAGRGRMFTTISLVSLDPATRRAEHLRAGHNPPLLWRAATGECEWRKPAGIGLGLTTGPAFAANLETERIEFAAGDTMVLYSDGVIEDMNTEGELFGEHRLEALVRTHAGGGPQRLLSAIMEEARRFRGQAEPHDDWTLLVVQCTNARARANHAEGEH